MSLRISDLPPGWRQPAAMLLFAGSVLVAAGTGIYIVRIISRAEAQDVVAQDRDAFKASALEAARSGAREAVRESVEPVLRELRAHDAWDHEAQRSNERRLDALETGKR